MHACPNYPSGVQGTGPLVRSEASGGGLLITGYTHKENSAFSPCHIGTSTTTHALRDRKEKTQPGVAVGRFLAVPGPSLNLKHGERSGAARRGVVAAGIELHSRCVAAISVFLAGHLHQWHFHFCQSFIASFEGCLMTHTANTTESDITDVRVHWEERGTQSSVDIKHKSCFTLYKVFFFVDHPKILFKMLNNL